MENVQMEPVSHRDGGAMGRTTAPMAATSQIAREQDDSNVIRIASGSVRTVPACPRRFGATGTQTAQMAPMKGWTVLS